MILILNKQASQEQVSEIVAALNGMSLTGQVLEGASGTLIHVLEDVSGLPSHLFNRLPAVEKVVRIKSQASLATGSAPAPLQLKNGLKIGKGLKPLIIAGPCSIEGQAHIMQAAARVRDAGAEILRGGAFKPRTSPYEFQGLGEEGLKFLAEAGKASGLPTISEVMAPEHVEAAEPYIDILQVGARNMYNYELLKELGKSSLPVMLKRALSATISEWLNAAEYIMSAGNLKVILCERGIRTFETQTRNTLDLSAVAVLKKSSSLPVIVDPSHGTGRKDLILPMSRAAIAAGADGLMIEVHECPQQALSDGPQAITPDELREIIVDCARIYAALNPASAMTASSPDHSYCLPGRF